MTRLERAVVEIAAALESMRIDYMIVGGIANAVWGEPRATIDVDVIFALLSFERDAVHRATRVVFGDRDVRVVTPEDLLLMKIISDRPRDLADAEALTRRRADTLDRAYLEPRLREFAESLERPEILTRWTQWCAPTAT